MQQVCLRLCKFSLDKDSVRFHTATPSLKSPDILPSSAEVTQ